MTIKGSIKEFWGDGTGIYLDNGGYTNLYLCLNAKNSKKERKKGGRRKEEEKGGKEGRKDHLSLE